MSGGRAPDAYDNDDMNGEGACAWIHPKIPSKGDVREFFDDINCNDVTYCFCNTV